MSTNSQKFVPIADISNDLVFLKNGSISLIMTTSAVNFGLLFETEQISLIDSFAGLLNSLSFPIQIVVHSKRLDVSSYLQTLDKAGQRQTNPKLQQMIASYRQFVAGIIKSNNVLDKQFYICLTLTPLEMGVLPKSGADKAKQASIILGPRRDHLLHQLANLGLKARQLTTVELVKLFNNIYNPPTAELVVQVQAQSPVQSPVQPPAKPPVQPIQPPRPLNSAPVQPQPAPVNPITLTSPFIVEELPDDFGTTNY